MATQNIRRLQAKLEEQSKGLNLILNDVILNDQSCSVVAEFLEKNNLFSTIELKGNNIQPQGFAIICKALQGAQNLKELYLEWNQIGQDSQEGLEALLRLLDYNGSIIMIDLKNNNINSDGAYIISRILEVNKNLLSLDLKWNEIGGKGAEMILEGLEKNTLLKNLDLSCNKIPEEMIAEVSRILTRNRSGNFVSVNVGRAPRSAVQEKANAIRIQESYNLNQNSASNANFGDNSGLQASQKLPPSYPVQMLPTKEASMSQVEKMLKNEKKRVSDMKDRIERDLLEEKRTREEFEVNLLKLRDSVLQKEGVISGLQLEFNNLVNENALYRRDLEAVKFDLSSLQEKYSSAIEELQIHIAGNNKNVAVMEREQIQEISQMQFDHQQSMKELIREWSLRYGSLDEKYISISSINADLKDRENAIREQMLRIRMDGEDQARSLKIRITDDTQRAFEQQVKSFENAIRVATEQRQEIIRKNEEIVKDIDYKESKYHASIVNIEKEIGEARMDLNSTHNKLSVRNMKIEALKTRHVEKDDEIRRREEELLEAQRTQQRVKDDNKEKADYIIYAHAAEKRLFKDSQDILHRRVVELERAIRSQEQQNSNIKTSYEKICHVLQSNLQRTVVDTLTFNQVLTPVLIQPQPQAIFVQGQVQPQQQQVFYQSLPQQQGINNQPPPQ